MCKDNLLLNTNHTKVRKKVSGHSLDTLELTSDLFKTKSHESLYRSAIRKHSTIATLVKLIDVSPPHWNSQYWKTYHCKNVLLQDGNKLIGSLCRKRWCQNCNRIRTAELINQYHEPLKQLQTDDTLYFVTLTCPTVQARNLRSEISKRYKAFTRIKDNMRKNYKVKLNGIRKTEVTYTKGKFHPHFHIIVQGRKEAELLQSLWLDQFNNANIKAQDIRPIDSNNTDNLVELFKYVGKADIKDSADAAAMHHIYKSIKGVRMIQTFGKVRATKKEDKQENEYTNADWIQPNTDIWQYDQTTKDYHNSHDTPLISTQTIEYYLSLKEAASAASKKI